MPEIKLIAAVTLATSIILGPTIGWSRGFGGGGGGGGFNRGGGGGGGFNPGGGAGFNHGGGGGFNPGGGAGFNHGGGGGFNPGGGAGFDRGGEGGAGGFNRGGEGFGGQGGFNRGGEGSNGQRNEGLDRAGGAAPSRSQLNSFLGMPSDEGVHHGYGGNANSFSGNRNAAAGAAYANRNEGGYGSGFGAYAPGARYGVATSVRGNYDHYGLYGTGWYGDHPGAWVATGWAAGAAWNAASWNTAGAWCGYSGAYPTYYDYGNNVTYQNGDVYMNGQDTGSAADYYNQASTLASTGANADASSDDNWLPLGVFAATKRGETSSHVTIQLAINKSGVVRGNYTDTDADTTETIQGSLDKESQKVGFTVGDDASRVVETGLYNLTKDESPALVHFGPDKTEQWLLVRIKKPHKAAAE